MDKTGTVYYKQSIQEVLTENHQRGLRIAEESATELALINKPEANKASLDGFTANLTSIYRSLASRVAKLSGVEQAKGQKKTLLTRFNKREQDLTDTISELSISSTRMKAELDAMDIEKIKTRKRTWDRIIHPLIIILLLGESLMNQESLSLLNSSGLIFRLFLALSISSVLYLLIWGMVRVWHLAKTNTLKWSILIGGTSLVLICMYALAIMRLDYLNSLPNSQTEVSIHLLVGINALFFISSLVAKLHFGITPEEKSRLKLFERLENECQKRVDTMPPLQTELSTLPQKRDDALAECDAVIVMGQYYQDEITQLHLECISTFIHTSNTKRSDGKVLCFDNFKNGIPTLNTYSFNLNTD